MQSNIQSNGVATDSAALSIQPAALLHLLQLASPSLPVGGYSYSQGLEAAMEKKRVTDSASARTWLVDMLHQVVARFEAPLMWRLLNAWSVRDNDAVIAWSELLLAGRDTAEMRAETVQMGYSLTRLMSELAVADASLLAMLEALPEVPFACAYAFAAVALDVPPQAALRAMLFGWAENQVLVCIKSIPLGQVAGQRLLLSLRADLEAAAVAAQSCADGDLCNWAPGLSLLSMQHEVQYSRLYRS